MAVYLTAGTYAPIITAQATANDVTLIKNAINPPEIKDPNKEAEDKRKEEEEKRKEEEEKRKAEEEKRQQEEAERKAEEEKREAEEAKRREEEDKRLEAERKRQEEVQDTLNKISGDIAAKSRDINSLIASLDRPAPVTSGDKEGGSSDNTNTGTYRRIRQKNISIEKPRPKLQQKLQNSGSVGSVVEKFNKALNGSLNLPSNTSVSVLPENADTGYVTTFTSQEFSYFIEDDEENPLVMNNIEVSSAKVYLIPVPSDDLVVDTEIFVHMLVTPKASSSSVFDAAVELEEADNAVFMNDDLEIITTVPESKDVNIAAYLEPNYTYTAVITNLESSSQSQDDQSYEDNDNYVGSSGSSCNSGISILALTLGLYFLKRRN